MFMLTSVFPSACSHATHTVSGHKTSDSQAVDFNIDSLRSYAQNHIMLFTMPYTETGSAHLTRNTNVHFSSTVALDEVYYVVYLCKQKTPHEYTINVTNNSGQKRRILMQEACPEGIVQAAGLPASYFQNGTAIEFESENTTEFIAITYKFKEELLS